MADRGAADCEGVDVSEVNGAWSLYRWYDEDGVLLYVGISNNVDKRIREHLGDSWWSQWGAVVDVDPILQGLPEAAARQVERRVIDIEAPVFNRAHATGARQRAEAYIAARGVDGSSFLRLLPSQRVAPGSLRPTARRATPIPEGSRQDLLARSAAPKPSRRGAGAPRAGRRLVQIFELDPGKTFQLAGYDNRGAEVFARTAPDGTLLEYVTLGSCVGVYSWPDGGVPKMLEKPAA
jgi:hypothetical protein